MGIRYMCKEREDNLIDINVYGHGCMEGLYNCEGRFNTKHVFSDGFNPDSGWYRIADYRVNEMKVLDGFGKKSVEKLLNSIEKSRNTSLERFIYSLSIPSIGKSVSKDISKLCEENFNNFVGLMKSSPEKLLTINGFGITMMNSMTKWWYENSLWVYELSKEFTFETPNIVLEEIPKTLNGKTFVVTGSVNHYKNRDELKADIVTHGGTVVGSVSSKTSYLINNDINSTSSKNQKAKSLNIPIISEDQFLEMIH